MVRLTDRPDMTLDVYRGRKTTIQNNNNNTNLQDESSNGGPLSLYDQSMPK